MPDQTIQLAERVAAAHAARQTLTIVGGGTHAPALPSPDPTALALSLADHAGLVTLEPSELVTTVRAGTTVAALRQELAQVGQTLAFEPPEGEGRLATIGGAVALSLAGPQRPYGGAARDSILGVRLINGQGEILRFGGEVMKNVAGYDLSRLQAGARGTLGVLLDISFRTWPQPEQEITLCLAADRAEALARVVALAREPWPLTGTVHVDQTLFVRFAGNQSGIDAARLAVGGELVEPADAPWSALRELRHPFFGTQSPQHGTTDGTLWCLHLPPASPFPQVTGDWLTEWGGARRWLRAPAEGLNAARLRALVASLGGSVRQGWWDAPPLAPGLARLQERIRMSFDPEAVLNRHLH